MFLFYFLFQGHFWSLDPTYVTLFSLERYSDKAIILALGVVPWEEGGRHSR